MRGRIWVGCLLGSAVGCTPGARPSSEAPTAVVDPRPPEQEPTAPAEVEAPPAFTPAPHPYWTVRAPQSPPEFPPPDFEALARDPHHDLEWRIDLPNGAPLRFGSGATPVSSCDLRDVSLVGAVGDVLRLGIATGEVVLFPLVSRAAVAANITAQGVVVYTERGQPLAHVAGGSAIEGVAPFQAGFVRVCADPPACRVTGIAAQPTLTDAYHPDNRGASLHDVEGRSVEVDDEATLTLSDVDGRVLIGGVQSSAVKVIGEVGERVEIVVQLREDRIDANRIMLHGFVDRVALDAITIEPDGLSRLWSQKNRPRELREPIVFLRPGTWISSTKQDDTKFAIATRSTPVALTSGDDGNGWIAIELPTPWGLLPGFTPKAGTTEQPLKQPSHFATPGRMIPNRCVAD